MKKQFVNALLQILCLEEKIEVHGGKRAETENIILFSTIILNRLFQINIIGLK
jgi:hypothetical protein